MLRYLFLVLLLGVSPRVFAQYSQQVKGRVWEKETHLPLAGATVFLSDTKPVIGAVTDSNGQFVLADVPVGKHQFQCNLIGFRPVNFAEVLVTSGHEVVLQVEMEESVNRKLGEVVVRSKREHINEMAIVSTRTFDVQETERYAGSRSDPARMASNFAGVQGADDSRNDIIIRGNSPQGVLWRMEGVDIPSPNHFSVPGTTGGPVSMLNSKTLSNSDFFMGAFPSEYGNATAGIFDLKLRNGNTDHYECTGQLGFLGTELAAEGPISRKQGSSFLIAYRYSTLKLFEGLHVKIGTNSIPNYQDMTFKLNFPLSKKTELSVFGIGGLSKIDLLVSNQTTRPSELYGEDDRDQYFYSNTGVVGARLSHRFNNATYTALSVALTGNDIGAHHDKVFRNADYQVDSLKNILGFRFVTNTLVTHWFVNRKLSARHLLRAGIVGQFYFLDFKDSSRQYPVTRQDWQHREDFKGNTGLLQAYAEYKFRASDRMNMVAGIHAQYFTLNGSSALEPRLGMNYRLKDNGTITLGYGLHSQLQPMYQYFAHLPENAASEMHNYNMGFTRSHHLVAGYERMLGKKLRMRSEVYGQYLLNVPVEMRAGSSFSGIDQGAAFSRVFPDTLQNTGTGYNYGLELTLEKQFSNGYYFMASGSIYDSKARGNDGVYRNTDYNGRFALNLLGGYEYKLSKNNTLITGAKITWAGGRLYSPPNVEASNLMADYIVVDSLRNSLRFPNYFRADLKLGLRINARKVTHEIALDLVNVFNTKNILSLTYSSDLAAQGSYPFITQYQLGFLPIFYYRIDFGFGRKQSVK